MKWRSSHTARHTALVLTAALLAGCAAPSPAPERLQVPTPVPNDGCSAGTVSRLYLGRDSAQGTVSEAQWQAFVNDAVTPRFPAGFTVLQAQGHWRDASTTPARTVREGSFVLEMVHDDAASTRERVRHIADDYRQRFAQQAVLVTQQPARWCVYGSSGNAVTPR